MSEGLKPCPFCGGTKIDLSEGATFRWRYVGCSECGAQMEFRSDNRFPSTDETWNDAAEVWNHRHPEPNAAPQITETARTEVAAATRTSARAAPSLGAGVEEPDVQWLHKFINCTPFGADAPASDIYRAHGIVDKLALIRPGEDAELLRECRWALETVIAGRPLRCADEIFSRIDAAIDQARKEGSDE